MLMEISDRYDHASSPPKWRLKVASKSLSSRAGIFRHSLLFYLFFLSYLPLQPQFYPLFFPFLQSETSLFCHVFIALCVSRNRPRETQNVALHS